jgi:predicted ester cyclase
VSRASCATTDGLQDEGKTLVWKDLTVLEGMHDRAAGRKYMQGWFTAFPDMQVRTTNRVFGDDFIAAEVEFTGTNSGPLSKAEWNCRQR